MVLVEEKQVATNILIDEIGVEKADADVQNEKANIEAEKARMVPARRLAAINGRVIRIHIMLKVNFFIF